MEGKQSQEQRHISIEKGNNITRIVLKHELGKRADGTRCITSLQFLAIRLKPVNDSSIHVAGSAKSNMSHHTRIIRRNFIMILNVHSSFIAMLKDSVHK